MYSTFELHALLEKNTPLVHYILKLYYPNRSLDEDCIQEGTIGLWRAIETFDSSKDVKFSTYAANCIRFQLCKLFRNERKNPATYSMNQTLNEDTSVTYEDLIAGEYMIEDEVISLIDLGNSFRHIISNLSNKDKKILRLRYNGKSQTAIAEEIGFSQAEVARVLRRIKRDYKLLQEGGKTA